MKKNICTLQAPAPIGVYSQAIQFENTIYISGQIAMDPQTSELVEGDFGDQVRQVFKNLLAITEAAKGSVDDILKLTIYLTDLKNFEAVNEVMKEVFQEPYPARAVLEVSALPKNAAIELDAVMRKPSCVSKN